MNRLKTLFQAEKHPRREMLARGEDARKTTRAAECIRDEEEQMCFIARWHQQQVSGRSPQGSNTYFEIILGFRLTSLWWKSSSKSKVSKILNFFFKRFYTQCKVQWKDGHKTSARRLSACRPAQCMRGHGGDVKLLTHRQEDTRR